MLNTLLTYLHTTPLELVKTIPWLCGLVILALLWADSDDL